MSTKRLPSGDFELRSPAADASAEEWRGFAKGLLARMHASQPMLAGEVAKLANLGPQTIRLPAHEAELQPELTPSGTRVYRRDRVERWLAKRAELKASLVK